MAARSVAQLKGATQLKEPTQFGKLARLGGQIADPPKSPGVSAAILLFLILILGLTGSNAIPNGSLLLCPMVFMILPLAIARRDVYTMHFNIFLIFCYLMNWFPHFANYPFSQLTSLLLYGYTVMVIPSLRQSVGWIRVGKFDASIWRLIAIASVLSCAALVAWVKWSGPDLSRFSGMLPSGRAPGMLLLNGLLFVAFNAAEEEIIWRGVMMEALDSAFGAGVLSIVIQAASFAAVHYLNGFPNGVSGSLIVFACGFMLGIIRRKSKGIVACWLAHMASDILIYCMVWHFVGSR